jgi:ATP-binding cassette subfamily B protein
VGFIPQRPFIFNQSLRDNLLMAAPQEPAPRKLDEALSLAQLDEVVERRRDQGGLDAVAGYLGNRLSGGEQQRIALGRLALQDPEVIICDEYTANIDVRTAQVISEAMRMRFRDRTRVVITHQLYSVKGADHIIVLDQGRAIDRGTHEELISRPGLYRDLWRVQALE